MASEEQQLVIGQIIVCLGEVINEKILSKIPQLIQICGLTPESNIEPEQLATAMTKLSQNQDIDFLRKFMATQTFTQLLDSYVLETAQK